MPDEKKGQTINEEAGLPDNWVPVDSAPIIPGSGGARPNQDGDRFLAGSLPQFAQLPTDFVKTGSKSPTAPNLSLMPLGAANANNNAAILSTIAEQASAAAKSVVGDMTWKGQWLSFAPYSVDDVVAYNISTYVALTASKGSEPDVSPTAWQFVGKNLNFRGQFVPVTMGIVQSTSSLNNVTQNLGLPFANANVKGNIIIAVHWYINTGKTSSSPTDSNLNTYTLLKQEITGDGIMSCAMYLATNIAAGANTVTGHLSGAPSPGGQSLCIIELPGNILTGVVDGTPQAAQLVGVGVLPTISIVTGRALNVSFIAAASAAWVTPAYLAATAGFIPILQTNNGNALFSVSYRVTQAAGTNVVGYTVADLASLNPGANEEFSMVGCSLVSILT